MRRSRRSRSIIDYHHIELDAPDALLAENAATESFVDVGNRAAFGNVTGHPSLPAVIDADPETETLAPTITSGPDLLAVRQQLLEQALRSGWTRSVDSSLHLEVDGKSLDAAAVSATGHGLPSRTVPPVRRWRLWRLFAAISSRKSKMIGFWAFKSSAWPPTAEISS